MIAVKLGVMYLLILSAGHRVPTIQENYDTWMACEQARIRIERQTILTGQCEKVPRILRDGGK